MALEDVLVAILPCGEAVPTGAGVLVDRSLVITCAHVVNAALGRDLAATGRPQGNVAVRLPASPSQLIAATVDEADDAWSDPPAGVQGLDFCLLRLASDLAISPAPLGIFTTEITGKFRAAGFPPGWVVDFAHGEIAGRDGSGLYLLRPPDPQLAVTGTTVRTSLFGFERRPPGLIHAGFSGGPVEIDRVIVGILTQASAIIADATAYMIPVAAFPKTISSQAEVYAVGAGVPVKTYLESIGLASGMPQVQLERRVIRLPDSPPPEPWEIKQGSIATALEQDRKLALVSEPGMGKSVALKVLERSLATDALTGGIHPGRCSIPILIELKSYRGEPDLTVLLARRVNIILRRKQAKMSSQDPNKTMEEWLANKSWKFLILLDGLDEVPRQFHSDVRIALDNLLNYPHRFVVSCRIADYDHSLRDHAAPYVLLDLLPDKIAEHLDRTLGKPGQQLFTQLRNDSELLSLASNPLMLEIMEEIARPNPHGQLPHNSGQLLNQFVTTMFLRRQSEGLPPRPPLDRVVTALATIGFEMLERGEVIANLGDIRDWQVPCGAHELEQLLEAAENWRLLFSDGRHGEPVQFIHPLFRDYFAAVCIDGQLIGTRGDHAEFLREKIWDRRWRQTMLMLCGISRRPVELIIWIADVIRTMANIKALFYDALGGHLPWFPSLSIRMTLVSFLMRCWKSGPAADNLEVQSAVVGALRRVLRMCPIWRPVTGAIYTESISAIEALRTIGDNGSVSDLEWFSELKRGPYENYTPHWSAEARTLFRAARDAAAAIREKSRASGVRNPAPPT